MRSVLDVQRALFARGFSPGPLDGIMGRLTRGAIERFQRGHDLKVTGLMDDATLKLLFPGEAKPAPAKGLAAPWYHEAIRLTGVREIAGKQHSPTILKWLERLKAPWRDDETAWCGTFVGWCIATTLPNEPLPDNPFGARNWMKFGKPIKEPARGAVAVFWRGKRNGWQGHVGFVEAVATDGAAVLVRGGNQGNAVSLSWLSTDRLLGYRWLATAPLPDASRIPVSAVGGRLSTNEA
ncbi:NlpC/P60 family protein [Microvirga roseola]|uniref:NlpC/P60 family protein n=1 Tax=Microvirga roseola TaxID=2883126 RepID=UPI001E5483F8|nr:TIGR02594 family protein [Microvirga roseola]